MKITYNGIENGKNLITFTNLPNILSIENGGDGNKASLRINVNSLTNILLGKEYTININDEIIKSISSQQEAINKRFYLTNNQTQTMLVASSIIDALRNCAELEANYNIYQVTSFSNNNLVLISSIMIEAKEIGGKYNLTYSTDMPSNALTFNNTIGNSTDYLEDSLISKVCVDVYEKPDERIGSSSSTEIKYITTLEKNYYKDKVRFDLSPILTTITNYNKVTPYSLLIYSKIDNNVETLGTIATNYSTIGYMTNQGNKFIPSFTNIYFAQNVSRGDERNEYNNTILYTYEPSIYLTLYKQIGNNSQTLTINYINSSYDIIYTDNVNINMNENLNNININLNVENFNKSNYIDVVIPNVGTVKYDVIKPLKATASNQRVYWHNSYGGTSFFDFSGDRSETHKTSNSTYDTSLFDYYTQPINEMTKIYDKTVEITVKLKSHLMKEDGVWVFNDLLNSADVWTVINNEQYKIIVSDIKFTETNIEGVWECELTYNYSLNETLM